ncbi:hypothetical protein N7486_003670 [Penicillium sp. IBT 16267x]|nr:hypothetical protein N7486_003670 [Penicillium sp. IBT 16267x]
MSFLTCSSDLAPLFRLLDNYDKQEIRQNRPTPRRTFTPAFDVRELADGYYLDGELPGVSQENIDIEFSDPTTLVIKGHTVRDYKNTEPSQESSPRRLQPTVEDEEEDSDSSASVISATSATSAKSTSVAAQPQSSKFHYWASERSTGEFQRTFTFPSRVDQNAVRASLRNGVLSVVVPKEATPMPKKIRIQ